MKKIIVDIYGADSGPITVINGCRKALAENGDFEFVLVGDKKLIEENISSEALERVEIIHTEEYVKNSDSPMCVYGAGDEYSIVKALLRLKDDDCAAFVSAGNTGAIMVGTMCRLGLLQGLKSPALATALPCKADSRICLVDCGANTECTPKDLQRFALMGEAFMSSCEGIENPKVALMSVGREKEKGNTLVKKAYPLLEELPINFIGNIEGNDFSECEAHVVVTDGFTGNVLMKNTEAAGKMALKLAKGVIDEENYKKLEEKIYDYFEFNSRGGATFLGAKKPVVKMHGCANEETVVSCINLANRIANSNLNDKISKALAELE